LTSAYRYLQKTSCAFHGGNARNLSSHTGGYLEDSVPPAVETPAI